VASVLRRFTLTGFRRPMHGQPAVLFPNCWLTRALLLGASCILFQAALLGIPGLGLGGGSARGQGQALALTTTVTGLSLGSAPATVTLTPLPELAPALRAAAPAILAVEGVSGQPAHPLRINVFVGKPDATAKTSTDDPHFAGYIAIAPKYGGGQTQGIDVSRDFDVSNLVLSSGSRGLQVTLVPVAGIAETPRGLSLRIHRIYLRRDR
jgi:Protein of unknown function (DUF_B2219)